LERTLYHNDVAVCAQKVRLALAEKELGYHSKLLDLRAGESHTPEYLKINPKGVVPALIDDGRAITESTVINEYLEESYPEKSLSFNEPHNNAIMRRWVMRTDTGLLRICGRVSFGIAFRHQEQSRQLASRTEEERKQQQLRNAAGLDHPEATAALINYDALLSELETQLQQNEWLAGDRFSLAECAILPYIRRLEDMALAWLWEKQGDRTHMNNWYARCKQRNSFKQALVDYLPDSKKVLMCDAGEQEKEKVAKILNRQS